MIRGLAKTRGSFELGKNFRNEGIDLTHVSTLTSQIRLAADAISRTPNSHLVVGNRTHTPKAASFDNS